MFLTHEVAAFERRIGEVDHRQPGDLRERVVEQREIEDIRHEAHLHRVLLELVEELLDSPFRPQRQRDPHLVERCAVQVRRELADGAEHRQLFDGLAVQGDVVVVEAADDEPAPRRLAQSQRDLAPQHAGADDRDVAQVVAAAAQRPQHQPQAEAKREMRGEAEDDPVRRPHAGKIRAGLGQEEEGEPDGGQQSPGVDQPAHLVEQRHAALRRVQTRGTGRARRIRPKARPAPRRSAPASRRRRGRYGRRARRPRARSADRAAAPATRTAAHDP